MWKTLKKTCFESLETQSLNQDPLENTFCVICLHCGSNNNPTVEQFVVALTTGIINGLAYAGLHNANCEGNDTEFLDNLHPFLEESCASPPNPTTSHGRETLHDGLRGSDKNSTIYWFYTSKDIGVE